MLFARRTPPSPRERLRVALWPRRSWGRSVRYAMARVRRGSGSRHQVALGVAIGVFVATLPFIGFQLILAAAVSIVFRASLPAALAATFWANPLTLPLIWFASHAAGAALLAQIGAAGVDVARLLGLATIFLGAGVGMVGAGSALALAILLRAVPIGIVSGLVAYGAARLLFDRHRKRIDPAARLNRRTSGQRMPDPAPARAEGTREEIPAPA